MKVEHLSNELFRTTAKLLSTVQKDEMSSTNFICVLCLLQSNFHSSLPVTTFEGRRIHIPEWKESHRTKTNSNINGKDCMSTNSGWLFHTLRGWPGDEDCYIPHAQMLVAGLINITYCTKEVVLLYMVIWLHKDTLAGCTVYWIRDH